MLIVDDSVVFRRGLTEILRTDPHLDIVGTTPNDRIALARSSNSIHLMTLDLEMPDVDGLQTMKEIRKLEPTRSVIMFSSLTELGASVILDAMSRSPKTGGRRFAHMYQTEHWPGGVRL